MEINEMTNQECSALLARAPIGRLGCSLDNQPYVIPVYFAYDGGHIYVFSTVGQKVEWMRVNPKVSFQTDQIQSEKEWSSVVVGGEYQELPEPQFAAERQHAASLLAKRYQWWLNALGQRQLRVGDNAIDPLFFRIRIKSMSGLRAA